MSLFPATPRVAAPVATAQRLTVQDANTASLWNLTDWQWAALTDKERADYRDRIVYAPNHTAGN